MKETKYYHFVENVPTCCVTTGALKHNVTQIYSKCGFFFVNITNFPKFASKLQSEYTMLDDLVRLFLGK